MDGSPYRFCDDDPAKFCMYCTPSHHGPRFTPRNSPVWLARAVMQVICDKRGTAVKVLTQKSSLLPNLAARWKDSRLRKRSHAVVTTSGESFAVRSSLRV